MGLKGPAVATHTLAAARASASMPSFCQIVAEAIDLPLNDDLEICGANDLKTAVRAITRDTGSGITPAEIGQILQAILPGAR